MAYLPITISVPTSVPSTNSNPNNPRNFLNSANGAYNVYLDYTPKMAPGGDFTRAVGLNVIINSIRNCLQTPLGSYPFDPTYGSLLYQKIFVPATQQTTNEIQYEAVNRILSFDDRVRIIKVDVAYYNNKKGFQINMYLGKYGENQSITIDFSQELYTASNPSLGS